MIGFYDFAIGIPTKQRAELLEKMLNKCKEQFEEYEIIITVEESEIADYTFLSNFCNVVVQRIPDNSGIGFARKTIIETADKMDKKFVFFADDDCKLIFNYSINDFIDDMRNNKSIIWLGAHNSIYALFFDSKSKSSPFPANFANTVFAIRIEAALNIGNFDENCFILEDNDLNLRIVRKFGNCIFVSKKIGFSKKRHNSGGSMCFKTNESRKKIVELINSKHSICVTKISEKRNDITVFWSKFKKHFKIDVIK